jgi:formate hydrogenlyase transcriptional activator
LRESEKRYRVVAESASDVIVTMDETSTILFINAAVERVFGYTPKELIGRKLTVLMPESLRRRHEEGMHRYLETDKRTFSWNSASFPGLHKSRGRIIVDMSFAESRMGQRRLFTGIMRDVTERKRAESRLNTQHAVTRILSESDSIAKAAPRLIQSICECLDWEYGEMWRLDPQTNLLTCCETWHLPSRDLTGFASASREFSFSSGLGLPGRVWKSGRPAWISDLTADGNCLRTSLTTKAGLQSAFAFSIVLGDETLGIMVFFSHEIREADENLLQMMASIGSQIGQFGERKRAEEALRESEERYRNVVETQTELICRFLPDTTLTFVNDAYCRYFRRTREQLIGTKFLELIPFSARGAVLENIAMLCTYSETKASEHEHQVSRPDGSIGWQRWINHLLVDRDGRFAEIQGVGRDITARKRAEEELKEALSEIKRLKERLEAENVYLRSEVLGVHRYGEMTGESEGIKKVLEQVGQVAPTDMTVLILGETGTGKELVARLVHERSGRRERPLVKVNCSTLPAELIESELFGHERGAFTGAVSKQVGRFELADGGTIFLDEVGELPLRLQSKLLRVLQEGEFERLGSAKTVKVDVRVVAATNRNLNEAAQRGRFRADLYYRLNVYPIEIPPLRERKGDIGLLAEVFLQESGRRLGKSFEKMPDEMIEALGAYSWPGNVRELENVIGRAAIISTAPTLQLPDSWNREVNLTSNSNRAPKSDDPRLSSSPVVNSEREATLGELEKTYILEVLNQTNWRIEGPKGAALILGLHPNTLRSRMNKLGVRRPAGEAKATPQSPPEAS